MSEHWPYYICDCAVIVVICKVPTQTASENTKEPMMHDRTTRWIPKVIPYSNIIWENKPTWQHIDGIVWRLVTDRYMRHSEIVINRWKYIYMYLTLIIHNCTPWCLCLLKFNVSFRHCYGHIGDRQKPGAGRRSPTLFDRLQGVF